MFTRTIDSSLFREMLFTGAAFLEKNKHTIDSMNVFPVPDGDTGTNMSMTMQRAVAEIRQTNPTTVEGVASALATGALKGARGNSGVILSQIFRGFSKALKGVENEIDAALLANAFVMGTEAAYKAVMKPKEGTMLTVSHMIGESVRKAAESGANAYAIIDTVLEAGEAALRQTPELLPVLKEANVLDSGGMGLLTIYHGFKMAIDGEELDEHIDDIITIAAKAEEPKAASDVTLEDVNDIKFGYCTEFFIIHLSEQADEKAIDGFRANLNKLGDSVVVVNDSGMIKVHVHSNAPGKVLQFALRLGEIANIKIENMREQNREIAAQLKASETEMGVVAVSVGNGIDEVFRSLGAVQLISGGQTMNPSIDVIAQAIKKVNARNVFVLPNNQNIIMAAEQAAEICTCNVIVIPSRTIVQGITAMLSYNHEGDVETNRESMCASLESVVSGAVTYAIRDSVFEGKTIAANDIIGLVDSKLAVVEKTVPKAAEQLIRHILDSGTGDGVVSIYFGQDTTEEDANALVAKLEPDYPDTEFLIQNGGQPLYYYYIAVE